MHPARTNRPEPKSWSTPEALFNGKDLNGWQPLGDPAKSGFYLRGRYEVQLESEVRST